MKNKENIPSSLKANLHKASLNFIIEQILIYFSDLLKKTYTIRSTI